MDKLRKTLLLMLLSPEPGEVMAAREAILRVAKSKELDAHQLVSVMTKELTMRDAEGNAYEMLRAMSPGEAQKIARHCWRQFEKGRPASKRERTFVQDMMSCSYWLSERQAKWLRRLGTRMGYGRA